MVACLAVIAAILYSFSPFTSGIIEISNFKMKPVCAPLPNYLTAIRFILVGDTILTLIIPSVLIIVLNVGITFRICNFVYHRRLRQASPLTEMEGLVKHKMYVRKTNANKQSTSAVLVVRGDTESPAKQETSGRLKNKITMNSNKPGCSGESSGTGGTKGGTKGGSNSGSGTGIITQTVNSVKGKARLTIFNKDNSSTSNLNRRNHLNFVFTSTTFHGGKKTRRPQNIHTCIKHSYQIRTTRVLVMVSTFFVVLNLPSHAFRLYAFVQYLKGQEHFSVLSLLIQQLLMILYYLNFALNMLLYCACSRSFRSSFKRLFNHWKMLLTTFFGRLPCPTHCCRGKDSQRNKSCRPARI